MLYSSIQIWVVLPFGDSSKMHQIYQRLKLLQSYFLLVTLNVQQQLLQIQHANLREHHSNSELQDALTDD